MEGYIDQCGAIVDGGFGMSASMMSLYVQMNPFVLRLRTREMSSFGEGREFNGGIE